VKDNKEDFQREAEFMVDELAKQGVFDKKPSAKERMAMNK